MEKPLLHASSLRSDRLRRLGRAPLQRHGQLILRARQACTQLLAARTDRGGQTVDEIVDLQAQPLGLRRRDEGDLRRRRRQRLVHHADGPVEGARQRGVRLRDRALGLGGAALQRLAALREEPVELRAGAVDREEPVVQHAADPSRALVELPDETRLALVDSISEPHERRVRRRGDRAGALLDAPDDPVADPRHGPIDPLADLLNA